MSLMNLFVAVRNALIEQRRCRHTYNELMALDDRSLADIGIHRSQISGLVYGPDDTVGHNPSSAGVFAAHQARLAGGHGPF